MQFRLVGSSDLQVSVLSFGSATLGGGNDFFKAWGQTDVDEATRLVSIALDAGITLFDSADSYLNGLAETILGKAIAGRRNRLLISTKVFFRTGQGEFDVGSSRLRRGTPCDRLVSTGPRHRGQCHRPVSWAPPAGPLRQRSRCTGDSLPRQASLNRPQMTSGAQRTV